MVIIIEVKMRKKSLILIPLILFIPYFTWAVTFVNSPPLNKVINTRPGNVKAGQVVEVPLITWGGDMATILANGNANKTTKDSIFGQKGLNFSLVRKDDFKSQIESYISGKTPFLRGTMGMINNAIEVLSKDSRTKPIIIYQMTWSNGGDCLVVKKDIKTAKDLKGKTIALQAYGPHVDYLTKVLSDAGLSMKDVNIKWVKDLTGTENAPAEAFYQNDIDAAFLIIPDGLLLTSNGTVGTGSEGSVKGSKILLSTITANRIIADVYAVRNDYFQQHKEEIQNFTHGLLIAQEQLKQLFKNKTKKIQNYKKMLSASAQILLDSTQATGDVEALYGDIEFSGIQGNEIFFNNANWPRNMDRLNTEIQTSFITLGLLKGKNTIQKAGWDYNQLKAGLSGTASITAPKFKKNAVAQVIAKKQGIGTLDEGELFRFEINFKPNQKSFSKEMYHNEFKKVIDLAATYGGAIITIEGNSDPHKYNKLKSKGATNIVLKRTKQAAKNLSVSRALEVRKTIKHMAQENSVPLDDSQLTVIGHGISNPKNPNPQTKEAWLANMRVVFRVIQIEAEDSVFEPLN